MMQYLAKAVNQRLSELYGQENVFAGHVYTDEFPYVHFDVSSATNIQENAGLRVTGVVYGVNVTISAYSLTWTEAAQRIDAIQNSFLASYPTLAVGAVHRVTAMSYEVMEEEEREADADVVYRGVLILEVQVTHG